MLAKAARSKWFHEAYQILLKHPKQMFQILCAPRGYPQLFDFWALPAKPFAQHVAVGLIM